MERVTFKEFYDSILKDRKIFFFSVLLAFIVGLVAYLVTPNEYVSSVDVSTTDQQNNAASALGGLASLAGINIQDQQQGLDISLYDAIVSSTPFLKDLVEQKVYFQGDSVYLQDYLAQKMIIGIPAKFKALFVKNIAPIKVTRPDLKGGEGSIEDDEFKNTMSPRNLEIVNLNQIQKRSVGILRNRIKYTVDIGKPIHIEVTLQDPGISAQVARLVVKLLSDYVENYEYDKGYNDLIFIQGQLDSAKKTLYAAQNALANAKDRNRNIISAIPASGLDRLDMEYQLALNVYNSLVAKLKTVQFNIEEEKPVLIVIEPPQLLSIKQNSSPRLTIYVILSIVTGVLIGIAIIMTKSFLRRNL